MLVRYYVFVCAQAVYSCQALEHDAEHYLQVSTCASSPPRATATRMPLPGQCLLASSDNERLQGSYSLKARTGAGEEEKGAALALSVSAHGQGPAMVHESSAASPMSLFGMEHTRRAVGAGGRGTEAAGRILLQDAQSLLHSSASRTLFGPGCGARADVETRISSTSTTVCPHTRMILSSRPPPHVTGRYAGLLPDVSKFCSGCGSELVRNAHGDACMFCTACGRRV